MFSNPQVISFDDLNSMSTEKLVELLHRMEVENNNILAQNGGVTKSVLIEQLRKRIFNETYKLPYCFKYISIGCIVIFTLLCAIITTIWCLWFDARLNTTNNYQNKIDHYVHECGNIYGDDQSETLYVTPLKTVLNYNETENAINQILYELHQNGDSLYYPPSGDSFDNNMEISRRFLLCVLISYLLSVFFWQPIIIAIKSLIRLIILSKKRKKNQNKINEATYAYFYRLNVNSDDFNEHHYNGDINDNNGTNDDSHNQPGIGENDENETNQELDVEDIDNIGYVINSDAVATPGETKGYESTTIGVVKLGSTADIELTNNREGKNNGNDHDDDSYSGSSLYLKQEQDMQVIFDNATKGSKNEEANVAAGGEFAD